MDDKIKHEESSGNVFKDLGLPNHEIEELKVSMAILQAKIEECLSECRQISMSLKNKDYMGGRYIDRRHSRYR